MAKTINGGLSFFEMARYFYRRKESYDEYEKTELNEKLERMYKIAELSGAIATTEPLAMFNSAYSVAVAMANSPDIAVMDIHSDILAIVVSNSSDNHTDMTGYEGDAMLCKWMVLCILYSQAGLPLFLRDYLEKYRDNLDQDFLNLSDEEKVTWSFLAILPSIVDGFHGFDYIDLRLHFEGFDKRFTFDGPERMDEAKLGKLISCNPTLVEQHEFLDYIWENAVRLGLCLPPDPKKNSYFMMTEGVYKDFSRRIDEREFLVKKEMPIRVSEELPPLPDNASEEVKEFYLKCQQRMDMWAEHMKSLEELFDASNKHADYFIAASKALSQLKEYSSNLEQEYNAQQLKHEQKVEMYEQEVEMYEEKVEMYRKENAALEAYVGVLEKENADLKEERESFYSDLDAQQYEDRISPEEEEERFRMEQEADEYLHNTSAYILKEAIVFCINYACNDKEVVQDSKVEPIKELLEELLYSPLASFLDQETVNQLSRQVHNIKKTRRTRKATNEKASGNNNMTHQFYGPVGQVVGYSGSVDYSANCGNNNENNGCNGTNSNSGNHNKRSNKYINHKKNNGNGESEQQ